MTTAELSNDRAAAIRHARRVSGQVGALAPMIAGNRPLADLAQQVVAACASLDALLLRLIELEIDGSPATRPVRIEVDRLLRLAIGQARHRALATSGRSGMDR